jgi:hypothetical protein
VGLAAELIVDELPPRVRLPILAFWGRHQCVSLELTELRSFQATPELDSGPVFRTQFLCWPTVAAEKWLIPEMSVDSGEGGATAAEPTRAPSG